MLLLPLLFYLSSLLFLFNNQVMEQATDAEKAMAVSEFLDFKRRNKVCPCLYGIDISFLYT